LEHVHREAGQRQRPTTGCRLGLVDSNQPVAGHSHKLAGNRDSVRVGVEVTPAQRQQRPGIGSSDTWNMPSIAQWPRTVERVADLLHLGEFAVAGWSAGGPYALACAAAMPHRVRAVATLAGMAPLECTRDVFELRMWADLLLIPAAQWSVRAAAVLLWLGRKMPERYLAGEIRRTAGSRDRAALDGRALQWVIAAHREATAVGVRGTAEDYRRFGGSWGFDLAAVRQSVTVWQGEQDTLLPMNHARRLATALPSSTLKVVASTGHYLPAVIADALLDDLAS
jgi:pimeloyl-ACP methyl ester carboxylesterase